MNGVQVLSTANGPHPPEKWAAVSASQIIKFEPTASASQISEGKILEAKIYSILLTHHTQVAELASRSNSGKVFVNPNSAVAQIVDAYSASPLFRAENRYAFEALVRRVILRHTESNTEVHRLHREVTAART